MVTIIQRERRKLGRFRLEIPARIETIHPEVEKETHDLLTANISSGGAFFHTKEPLPEGTPVKIEIILPFEKLKELKNDHKQAHIKVTGRVLRLEPKGMAIEFDQNYVIRPWDEGQKERNQALRPSA